MYIDNEPQELLLINHMFVDEPLSKFMETRNHHH